MDNVKSLKVKLNEEFLIETEELASAGYRAELSFNENYFELVETSYMKKNLNDKDMLVGGSSKKVFKIKPKLTGNFVVEVVQKRPFEINGEKLFENYTISVF